MMPIETRPTPSRTFKWGAIFLGADDEAGIIGWTRSQRDAEELCRISTHVSTGVVRMFKIDSRVVP